MNAKNVEAIQDALAKVEELHKAGVLSREEAALQRLQWLKAGSRQWATINLGHFCRAMEASEEELGKLLLDRAAQEGLRPESDLIPAL